MQWLLRHLGCSLPDDEKLRRGGGEGVMGVRWGVGGLGGGWKGGQEANQRPEARTRRHQVQAIFSLPCSL